jgi:hypothetical protein
MHTEKQMHDIRELNGAAQLRQLTDAELDGISGGGDPDYMPIINPLDTPHLFQSLTMKPIGTCPK